MLNYYVKKTRNEQDFSQVTNIGMDETSSKKGHNYVSIFVDMDESKVLFATEGKDAETVKAFTKNLEKHGGKAEQIKEACCDMSPAYISGVENEFENAAITFDKFHVVKILNAALDEVRRQEQKTHPELKKTRWFWLKNEKNQTDKEFKIYENLKNMSGKTARATHLKINFQELYSQLEKAAEKFLKRWYFWTTHSRIKPMIEAAKTIKSRWDGVLRWFDPE